MGVLSPLLLLRVRPLVLFTCETVLVPSICVNQPSFAGIRLAGATNDVHIMDFETGKWTKIEPQGDLPAPRAAHAAVAVGSMMVVQARYFPYTRMFSCRTAPTLNIVL